MAFFTIGTERLIVRFVFFMTGQAVRLEFDGEYRFDVARCTFDGRVCAEQGMAGVESMVEPHIRPAGRRMAGVASLPEVTFMIVVFCVAGKAARRQAVRERIVTMTGIAFLFRVFAVQ